VKLFQRLMNDCGPAWSAYAEHAFVEQMGSGTLPDACFRRYLVQDYLFLIQFARAYALAIYKSPTPADMRAAVEGVKAIVDVELDLHVEFCASWGMSREDIEAAEEATETMAYTRFVLEAGMAGDLLDLQVALAPCILGYAEIGKRLAPGRGDANPYERWIAEYSSDAYQAVAGDFEAWLETVAGTYLTEARYPRLRSLFNKATLLEADFWQMGLDVGS
jgi:thiaminase/transcriptional activator TenA